MKKEKNPEPQILMTLKTDVRREVRRTTPMWDLMAMPKDIQYNTIQYDTIRYA